MTDDVNDKQPLPRPRPAPGDAAPPADAQRWQSASAASGSAPAPDDDPLAALERLQSLTDATPAARTPLATPKPRRPTAPAVRASRPRPAAAPRAGRTVARIAAPVVFLVAVVVLLSIVAQSGVIGDTAAPVVTPTPAATKTKTGGTTQPTDYKVYVVKSGDTISGIAIQFDTTISAIEALNPKLSSSTLVVGTKVKVPKPVP
jgi:LysM repeat protein